MKKKNASGEEMTFLGHLGELRKHLFRSAVAVAAGFFIAMFAKEYIFNYVILAPQHNDFITYKFLCFLGRTLHIDQLCLQKMKMKIINTMLSGQFMMHMYISMICGIILAMPYVVWELWRFIKPALTPDEQKNSRGAVIVISLLFFTGIGFSYMVLFPWTINFLGTYVLSPEIENNITIQSYVNTMTTMILWTGVVFELPVVVYFLSKVGIITPSFLKKSRRYAIVIIFIIAAIITPPDIFSQTMMAIPLILLYEASILVSKRAVKKSEKDMAG